MLRTGTFSIKELTEIENNYLIETDRQLATRLNRNPKSIKTFRGRNGLKKNNLSHPRKINKQLALPPGTTAIWRQRTGKLHRYVRLTSGKWVAEHRLKWEQEHGPIPTGFVLQCLTSDTLNTDPKNWQLLTRSQQLRLNRQTPNRAAAMKATWGKIKTLEANGLKHRYGWKTRKRPVVSHTAGLPTINRHVDFQF